MSKLLKLFIKNDSDYMLLNGNNNNCLFLFVHGYGSSPLDLLPLAKQININGHACALMLLSGHGGDGYGIKGHFYAQWKKEILDAIHYYKKNYDKIYLIGFSLGATLCLDISDCKKVSGVVGISTFISLKRKSAQYMLSASSLIGLKMIPRFLQSTSNKTKNEVDNPNTLPSQETIMMIEEANSLLDGKNHIHCDSLLIHSIDDNVSDYDKVKELMLAHSNVKLITLRNLNHLLQFDIPQPALCDVILEFFSKTNVDTDNNPELIKDLISLISTEFNHWSGILFQLILGFFSIFGALVYFSLPDILQGKSPAPYYLTSYVIVNSLFVIIAAMYFFYTNRINVYMKHHLEPYLEATPWVTYRTNNYLSGKESVLITNRASMAIIGIPITVAAGSLMSILYQYGNLYVTYPQDNVFLISSFLFALLFFIISLMSIISLKKYTDRELYKIMPEKFEKKEMNNKVLKMYLSIQPGCVRQTSD